MNEDLSPSMQRVPSAGNVMRTLQERIVLVSLLLSLACAVQVGSAPAAGATLVHCPRSSPRWSPVPSAGRFTAAPEGLERSAAEDQALAAVALEQHEASGRQLQGALGVRH